MNTPARLSGVHLVGSVPVDGAEEMFRLSMRHLGGHLKRMPDGEAGERDTWIRWQYAKIGASPQMRANRARQCLRARAAVRGSRGDHQR